MNQAKKRRRCVLAERIAEEVSQRFGKTLTLRADGMFVKKVPRGPRIRREIVHPTHIQI